MEIDWRGFVFLGGIVIWLIFWGVIGYMGAPL